jgi:hypothetical protein
MNLIYEFVEYIPDDLKDGIIYVSITYATVVHRCCCGCGNEVITPLSPTDWRLIFDGESISLDPSIGNWNFACQSHYWIRRNTVKWAPRWSKKEINAGRNRDALVKKRYYDSTRTPVLHDTFPSVEETGKDSILVGLWRKLRKWLFLFIAVVI